MQVIECSLGIVLIEVFIKIRDDAKADIGYHAGEGLVDFLDDAVRTLLRDGGRQRILLLIGIEVELAWFGSFYIEREKVRAEVFGKDNAGIVFAGLCSFNCIGAISNDPIDIVIAAELREHLIAQIKLQGGEVAFVAFILAGHSNLELVGISKRIPASQHVEGREKQRDDGKAKDDDRGHYIGANGVEVIAENGQNVFHDLLASLSGVITINGGHFLGLAGIRRCGFLV